MNIWASHSCITVVSICSEPVTRLVGEPQTDPNEGDLEHDQGGSEVACEWSCSAVV